MVEGSAEIIFSKSSCRLTPGKLYLVPPFTTHSNRCDGLFTHYYIHVYEPADSVSGLFEDYTLPCEVKAEPTDEWLFQRLCAINSGKLLPESDPRSYDNPEMLLRSVTSGRTYSLAEKIESDGSISLLFARFLANATSTRSHDDTRIQRTLRHIRKNISRNIPIDTLADMACLSKDHFIRLFKKECGESPVRYINHRKIELAETMLITTSMTIKQIADELGFSDYSYFTRLFHKTTGTAPAHYRKRAVKRK